MSPTLALRASIHPLPARRAPRWPRAALSLLLLPACDYTQRQEPPCTPVTVLDAAEAPCPEGMAAVSGGSLYIRHAKRRPGESAVTVPSFCIDRAEVTVARYLTCAKAGDCGREHLDEATPDGKSFLPEMGCNVRRRDLPDHPMNCVDFPQAERFCAARGARLPTEEELEWVAQGGTCPNNAYGSAQWLWEKAKGPRALCTIDQQTVDGTCVTGANPTGDSPPGIHDLVGNVWEWTASNWGTSPKRVIRGGSWMSRNATPWYRAGYPPEARQSDLGFRCAADRRSATPAP